MTHNSNFDPEYYTLEDAIERAKVQAKITNAAQTVVVEVTNHKLGFYVLLSASYAELREKKRTDRMAPVASVLPNDRIEVYMESFRRFANV
jgi:hypothetical protein